jgi:hypothetical protein
VIVVAEELLVEVEVMLVEVTDEIDVLINSEALSLLVMASVFVASVVLIVEVAVLLLEFWGFELLLLLVRL